MSITIFITSATICFSIEQSILVISTYLAVSYAIDNGTIAVKSKEFELAFVGNSYPIQCPILGPTD